jgi:hypothetical protein
MSDKEATMNTRTMALCACVLLISACGGADDIEMVGGEDIGHEDQALDFCPTHPPELDAPLDTAWLTLSGGGAEYLYRTSPDAEYSTTGDRHYVTQINGSLSSTFAVVQVFAFSAFPATTQASCDLSRLDATLHCFTAGSNCWSVCGKQSVSGMWYPYADGSGGICSVVAIFNGVDMPGGTKSARIQAAAYDDAVAVPVTEGVSMGHL